MPTGINNSVLYIDYLQKVKNNVIPYWVFYHTRPQALAQFHAKKSDVLHKNGKGYSEENKDLYRSGLQSWPLQ